MSFKLILKGALLEFGQKPIREVWMIKGLLIAINMTETRCNDFIPAKYIRKLIYKNEFIHKDSISTIKFHQTLKSGSQKVSRDTIGYKSKRLIKFES